MRSEHRRAMRAIGAALISSGMSSRELESFAEDLNSYELRNSLERMIFSLAKAVRFDEYDNSKGHELVEFGESESLFEFVQRKRLSRSKVIDAIKFVAYSKNDESFSSGRTIREMIDSFSKSHPNKTDEFRQFVEGDRGDPYLKGIMDRKKA